MGFEQLSPRPFACCKFCVANEARPTGSINNRLSPARRARSQGNRLINYPTCFSACLVYFSHFVANSDWLWWRESLLKKGGSVVEGENCPKF